MSATLLELPKATVADIPRVLRAIADQIEAGAFGNVTTLAVAAETEQGLKTFGAGAADAPRAIALFTGAAHILTHSFYDE